ncbi:MAG: universal stress protein [Deltaproteobacteria bacterium]|nr:universal stress protein [Deltaproteobacteria bacterium]
MYHFNHLMVGLTLSARDKAKIRYASLVSSLVSSRMITFVHVGSTIDNPASWYFDHMKEAVGSFYRGPSDVMLDYHLIEDGPRVEKEMLELFSEKKVDLIIVGRIRGTFTGKETLPVRLTRKAQCSVLFVPEEARPSRTRARDMNILVPIDFSENSADAMKMAMEFAAAHSISQVFCVHVFHVPLGYYKRGKSYEEFSRIMHRNAREKCVEFLGRFDQHTVAVTSLFKEDTKAYRAIESVVSEYTIDLIVIGSRGRRGAARVLMESVTEQLIRETTVPLLAVKEKGKGMGLVEALRRL